MGITIKDAPLVEQLSGDEKIPISDGSNEPRTVNIEQIKEFANKDIEIPTKVSELENDSGYATSKEVEDAISKIPTPDVGGQISAALVDYVKKVEGKGLSTNDFTDVLKAKLEDITPYDPSELEAEVDKLETALNTLVGGNASNAIESFNEIIAFLDGISDNEDLDSIIASIEQQIASKYSKPLSGIPKSDFSSDVQSSLNKAETALQEEQFKGTVVAVDTDESVDDPNIPSGSYDDTEIKKQIAGLESEVERKQENLISGQNIKTINGKSLLGEGDIEIERGDSYDDTELKNQITDLETEVSKKADEAETASKLSELGSYVEWVKDFDLDLSFVSREAGYWRVDGTLGNQNDLWHTKPIKINKGSIFVGTEFSSTDSISIITQVLKNGDFVKTLLVGSNDKYSYSYEFDEDCFVSISYGSTLKTGEAVVKIKGEIEDIRELVKYNSEEVTEVKESLSPLLGGKLDFSDIEWENDKAIKPIGISSTIGYYLSEPIKVFYGTTIKVYGVLATSVIAISKTDSEGNIKELLLQGQGSDITEYNWVAESECYIRISSTTKVGSITHKSVETTLEEHSETLNRIENSYTIDLSTLLIIDGFVNVNGTANSNSGFYRTNPIKVYRGDVVEVTTNTTSAISIVSKVNQDGSYTSVLSGNENKTYQWVADEECNIVISTIRKIGTIIHKSVEDALEEHSKTLNHIDVELDGVVIDAYKQGLLDKAWKTDGTLGFSGSFSRSNVIEVKNGDTVYLDGIGATDLISVITRTDVNGEYIGTLVIGKNGGGLYTYKCPFDGYIVISSSTVKFKEGVAIVTRKGIKDKLEEVGKSFWTGKRIMAIGDSLCASTDTRNWQYVMGDILGCNIRTHAKGGIGLIQMVDGDGTEKPEADPDNFGVNNIYPLEDSDVEDVDLILIFGAYNEYRRALNEYGTMNDMYPEQNTFLGRLRYVANKLTNLTLSANKECRIAFISTYCFGGGSYCNSTGYIAGEKILDGFKEVGKEFSIPVIDLLHEGQISKYNWDTFCSGAGKENTTYLPYDESVPYGVPSIFPSINDLPSSTQEGIVALVQSDNEYGYVYSQYKDGAWKHNIWPWSSGSYPPYMYLWKDFIHLNFDGHNRVAQYIAKQVNTL